MAKKRLKSPRARLFVALELPDEIRAGLAAWQRAQLDPIPVLRAVEPDHLHVTLAFLSHRPVKEIPRIAGLLDEIQHAAPELRFDAEPAARPPGRPRLFAIEAESAAAISLQKAVSDRLERARLYEPEKRDFWPHVTVARTRRERRGSNKPAKVDIRPGRLPEALTEPFFCRRMRLYRSNLRPQGAQYEPLSSTDLKAST
jgi:RNA 2',3'-cyclic 3'-phosphodiesterase